MTNADFVAGVTIRAIPVAFPLELYKRPGSREQHLLQAVTADFLLRKSLVPRVPGGAYDGGAYQLAASSLNFNNATLEHFGVGFRLAMIPEPGTDVLVALGLVAFASRRRIR